MCLHNFIDVNKPHKNFGLVCVLSLKSLDQFKSESRFQCCVLDFEPFC